MTDVVDINEDLIRNYDLEVLEKLLFDHTTRRNIFWATEDYKSLGPGYEYASPITPELITGPNIRVIRPRTLKARELQSARAREMAEVFTPSWICNAQNNLVDEAWFGRPNVFNTPNGPHSWTATTEPIAFPEGKTWKDYVRLQRLEITCGEGPYLVSLYDATTGYPIPISQRIGLLDRKLRVVSENAATSEEWLEWAKEAYHSLYAYEWQGDSLLLAREAMLYSFFDYYRQRFGRDPQKQSVRSIAYIVSWNLWQMDGLKCVVPDSCHPDVSADLFGNKTETPCPGCAKDSLRAHNGTYCLVRDWHTKNPERKKVRFVDLISQY